MVQLGYDGDTAFRRHAETPVRGIKWPKQNEIKKKKLGSETLFPTTPKGETNPFRFHSEFVLPLVKRKMRKVSSDDTP